MRYFNLGFCRGKMQRGTFLRYQRHLASLEGILPAHVLELTRMAGIHDACFVEVGWSENRKDFSITLRGNWGVYFDLTMTYSDAVISPVDEWAIARIVRSSTEYILYREFDRTCDGLIENRILCHTGHWFTIRCRGLRWTRIDLPAPGHHPVPERADRFPGGPPTPYLITRGALDPYASRLDWRLPAVQDSRHPEIGRYLNRQGMRLRICDRKKRLCECAAS